MIDAKRLCIIPLSHFHNIKGIWPSHSPYSIIPANVMPYNGSSVLIGESGRISAITMPLLSPAPDSAIHKIKKGSLESAP